MAEKGFQLEIVTLDRQIYSGEVVSVVAPGVEGSFGVLANHAPMIAGLATGELRLRDAQGAERALALTGGGFFEVSANKAIVLADGGEWQSEIDLGRAEKALTRAKERLVAADPGVDRDRAQRAVDRARIRVKVARGPQAAPR
jgi:F-type H+-transporting ATPase subunit epsilon